MATSHECTLSSWGANSYGQLGLGDTSDRSIPTTITHPVNKLRQISGGGAHTLFLTEDGELYGCGWNRDGQLGTSTIGSCVAIVTPVTCLPKLVKVACGWSHTLSITESGHVISWGSNKYYQLARTQVSKEVSTATTTTCDHLPSTMFGGEHVVDIGAGMRHSTAITTTGSVYVWGDGKKGQLGLGDINMTKLPTRVNALNGIFCTSISLGAQFTTIRTVNGEVYCCGDNRHGQCTGNIKTVILPYKVNRLPSVIEVHCGWSHCVAITEGRRVYVWGRGDYGQLGNGDRRDQFEPVELPQLQGVACGSEHTIVITGSSEVMSWGWNEHGNCGTDTNTDILTPTLITTIGSTPLIIGTGTAHSFLSSTNKV